MKKIIVNIMKNNSIKDNRKIKRRIAESALELVKKEIKISEIIKKFGGSFAKGTWLSKDADVDIFVRFKKSTWEENLKKFKNRFWFIEEIFSIM